MSILKQLNQSKEKLAEEKLTAQERQESQMRKHEEILTPAFEYLEPLSKEGYKVQMHRNPYHYPCPAIHIKLPAGTIEIYFSNDKGTYQVGPCNRHVDTHISTNEVEALGAYVTEMLTRGNIF